MKIIIAHSHLDALGGGERCVLELARGLSLRHAVEIWTSHYAPSKTYAGFANLQMRHLTAPEWLGRPAPADVVISHSFAAHLLALRHRRTLCYIHTLRSRYMEPHAHPALLIRNTLDQLALRRAARIATNSAYAAHIAQTRYGRPVAAIAPGVRESLRQLPVAAGAYGLFIGRLAPEKGVERLLSWHRGLHSPLHLVGTGNPEYVQHLRSLAGNEVLFRGALQDVDLDHELAGCRYLTLLAEREEFGLAVLEAMAAGKPVIGMNAGGLRELLRDGATGYLVASEQDYQAAVEQLRQSDQLCLRMGQAGRATSMAYSWQAYVDGIEAECERLVAEVQGPSFTASR